MLKILLTGENGTPPMVVLGLTDGNIHHLLNGEPMMVNQAELGLPPVRIALVYGATNQDLKRQLRSAGINVPDLPNPQPGERIEFKP